MHWWHPLATAPQISCQNRVVMRLVLYGNFRDPAEFARGWTLFLSRAVGNSAKNLAFGFSPFRSPSHIRHMTLWRFWKPREPTAAAPQNSSKQACSLTIVLVRHIHTFASDFPEPRKTTRYTDRLTAGQTSRLRESRFRANGPHHAVSAAARQTVYRSSCLPNCLGIRADTGYRGVSP